MRLAAAALALLAVAGCGSGSGDDEGTTTSTKTPTVSSVTTPTATTPTVPRTQPRTTTTTSTSPEEQPGGAGDENPTRVPAQFTYRDGRLTPPLITVPATFRIAVSITFAGGTHIVRLGNGPATRTSRFTRTLPGLPKGRSLAIAVDGRPAGRIVSGLNPGP